MLSKWIRTINFYIGHLRHPYCCLCSRDVKEMDTEVVMLAKIADANTRRGEKRDD